MKAVVALGSNLGECKENLHTAINHLNLILNNLKISPFTETKPVGGPEQNDFLNAVIEYQSRNRRFGMLSSQVTTQ